MSRNKDKTFNLLDKVRQRVIHDRMLEKGDTVVCAVSGGADSMVMLHILNALKAGFGLRLVVAHLNHNLRGKESASDCAFVKSAARALGLRFISRRLAKGALGTKGESLQDEARKSRYIFFADAARLVKAQRVATGHTLDDQAETVLIRFIKGASSAGLGGIPPVRGIYIRPLIDVTRAEIEDYAAANKITFVTDSSNLTDKYLRNSIRNNLIPVIESSYNPNIKETIARTAGVLYRDNAFLEAVASEAYTQALLSVSAKAQTFSNSKLRAQAPAILSRIFLKAVATLSDDSNAYSHDVDAFVNLVASKRPNITIKAGGAWIIREYDSVIISLASLPEPEGFSFTLKGPGVINAKEAGFRLKATLLLKPPANLDEGHDVAYFDYDAVTWPIIVRPYLPGDRMQPIGMKGRKKIKDIYIDAHIPASSRPRVPLLLCADTVIWAAGVKRSEMYKITEQTRRVLKVEYIKRFI